MLWMEGHQSADTPAPSSPVRPRSGWREAALTVGTLLAAFGVAVFISLFVLQSFEVDGQSMEPTLDNHDRLIVLRAPVTWSHITGNDYIPARGDIIVFNENLSDFGQGSSKKLIKRVVGLPGDHIVVKDGIITVFNKAHPNGFVPARTLPFGSHIPSTPGNEEVTLGPDQLFVCGDNRPNSLDSRSFGPIDAKNIVGKLVLRVYPFSDAKAF